MFKRVLLCGGVAGIVVGFVAALLQLYLINPLIRYAELFEQQSLTHFNAGGSQALLLSRFLEFDLIRDGLSIGFSMALYVGFAIILVAFMGYADAQLQRIRIKNGLIWGFAGFVTMQLAPAFSLAPNMPGFGSADVYDRQIWWFATVIATGLALWIIVFAKDKKLWLISLILLIAPHIIGAPQPTDYYGQSPPELASLFTSRVLGIGLFAWVILGGIAAHLWNNTRP